MTRRMYDAVTVANLPAGGDLYAGYVNGRYANLSALRARFPSARIVTISVTASGVADVLDVERFDATPEQAPGWVRDMRAIGRVPTVYCRASAWSACMAAFYRANVAGPFWWIANYDGDPAIPAGAVAKQFGGNARGGYDVSSVADYWPGIDQKVTPMHTPPIALRAYVADCACPTGGAWVLADNGDVYAFGGAAYFGDPSGESYWSTRLPASIRPSTVPGKAYDVIDTAGEVYTFPV